MRNSPDLRPNLCTRCNSTGELITHKGHEYPGDCGREPDGGGSVHECPDCQGPDYSDGCSLEGFVGGCERMGCHPKIIFKITREGRILDGENRDITFEDEALIECFKQHCEHQAGVKIPRCPTKTPCSEQNTTP